MADDGPLDAFDPRFPGAAGSEADDVDRRRSLVASRGPGPSQGDPKVRLLRVAVPLLAVAAIVAIGMVFVTGLAPGETSVAIGPEPAVREAVAERPYRYCYNGNNPCAWLTVVDDDLVAFNTNGPLPEEYGRMGVAWCASSGYFGANATGSVWDQQGRIVEGPAHRSLDRYGLEVVASGDLVIRFASLTAGRPAWQVDGDVSPPGGEPCEQIPFDRAMDLVLEESSPPR